MTVINEKAKRILEDSCGLSLSQVCNLSVRDEVTLVKRKTGGKVIFSNKYDVRKVGRGNPLLARKKFTTMEDINARIDTLRK